MKNNFPIEKLSKSLANALQQPQFEQLKISLEQQQQLLELLAQLHKWNGAYNLTSVRDPQEMLIRHVYDSIAVSTFLHGERIIDVGTGPGLPGLPLAIINPTKEFVLLDSLGKRISFIRQVAHLLGLKNVTAVQSRVEDYQPEQKFDSVVSRAFASLADMLGWCHHLSSSTGRFIALKGQLYDEELADVVPPFQIMATHAIDVPELDAARHVVEIIKQ
ncbi:16S rRNA (guanine(527)-N(7))-methyltransferase RsmG [Aliidiomarina quisquiliarum]|uniref:16S rRNA (guanine(527)-N(7))-methyltransferase RsmG n=1 Tax=Aliidiomarina quisquiliarum TaxID=2938947 RepID=UPI00208ED747|nr:16S rRNA (guanine(527)-N(7))-methyltransferase RsmG [Aliidiomarina quisquiliarum]MCO4321260.1 16S rRNA (guanine(527)-N(7))-methyltransferase RsmG [Aliidiomarina quisquiliarum]